MLRSVPLSLSLLLSSALVAQVPNGGFESWNDDNGTNEPVGWITLNEVATLFGAEVATQGMPGAVGTSYLRLTTVEIEKFGPVASMAFVGAVTDDDVLEGFPYTQRPDALVGQLKYAPAGADVGAIYVALTRWDAGSGSRVGVAGAAFFVEANTPNWTTFTIPLEYAEENLPDTASITILASSGDGAADGTVFSIDDLHFTGVSTGLGEHHAGGSALLVSPNPVIDHALVSTVGVAQRIEILGADGRCVRMLRPTAERTAIDLSALSGGSYIVRATLADGIVHSSRLLKP